MKSLLPVCFIAGSALLASNTFTGAFSKSNMDSASYFTCDINGNAFSAAAQGSSLLATFTYNDNKHLCPAALFVNAAEKKNSNRGFHIQPVDDGAPSAPLTAHNNLYNNFYITYKAVDNTCYNTTTAPGNFEITAIDTANKTITGKLNCILYSSSKQDWLLVTNGRFRLKF